MTPVPGKLAVLWTCRGVKEKKREMYASEILYIDSYAQCRRYQTMYDEIMEEKENQEKKDEEGDEEIQQEKTKKPPQKTILIIIY